MRAFGGVCGGGGGEGGGAGSVGDRVGDHHSHIGDHFGHVDAFGTHSRESDEEEGVVGTGARFLGPGEAVGEDTVLRGVDELAEGDVHVGAGGALRVGGRRSRTGDVNAAAPGSELSRTRAVRDAQLLWIPSAGLESLARVSPRAFVPSRGAWAPGRAAEEVAGSAAAAAAAGSREGTRAAPPRGGLGDMIGDTGSLFSAGGISGAYSADHHPGKASHAHPNAAEDIRRGPA